MLAPNSQKWRKAHKGRIRDTAKRGTTLDKGSYGLKSLDSERVTARQLEAARRAAVRLMKREGKFWTRVFPYLPVSKKPAEVRMGKGKGSVEFYAARVAPGTILFEIEGVSPEVAEGALRLADSKLPVRTKIVRRYE